MKRSMKRQTGKRNHKRLSKAEFFTFLRGKKIFVTLETFLSIWVGGGIVHTHTHTHT